MSSTDFADRITFHPDKQTMEVDFSDLVFDRSRTVNAFYDEVERRLAEKGQKWFFLVNYLNCRIMNEAWIAFAHRGKKVNIAYSLGSVRYAASGDTSETIMEKSKEESFDPNLFPTREAAIAEVEKMRAQIPAAEYEKTITKTPDAPQKPLTDRIEFHDDQEIMEVDFSDYTFANSSDVNAFYDAIAEKIEKTNRSWYFMVNYNRTEILPDAWYRWSVRSKQLNAARSLGTVRFSTNELAKEQILKRSEADHSNPNLVGSREAALTRIDELREKARGR